MILLHPGTQDRVLFDSPTASGSKQVDISVQSDAVMVTLFATSVTGTLDVEVFAITNETNSGEEALLFSFPQLSAATTNLLLRRSSITTSAVRIRVTYSNGCSYSIHARAVGSASSDTRILGASNLEVSQVTVGTGAVILIPAALVDRSGLVIKNWSATQTIYIAESQVKATSSTGWPLAPKDGLAVDVSAGVEVWAVSDAVGADVRLAEVGN